MSTFESIANQVVMEAGLERFGIVPTYVLSFWMKSRYRQVIDSMPFGNINQQGDSTLLTAPKTDTGTVTLTQGQAMVSGIGTTWDYSLVGQYFRPAVTTSWYRILDVAGGNDLLLDTGYAGDSVSGASYVIAQRFALLGTNLRWIIDIKNSTRNSGIEWISRTKMDEMFPSRTSAPGTPQYACPAGFDPETGYRMIELYPYSDQRYRIEITGYANIDEPEYGGSPVHDIEDRILAVGCMADAAKFKANHMDRANLGDLSKDGTAVIAYVRSMLDLSSSYERDFQTLKDQMSNRDTGDAPRPRVRLITGNYYEHTYGDIITAEQEIWNRGPR